MLSLSFMQRKKTYSGLVRVGQGSPGRSVGFSRGRLIPERFNLTLGKRDSSE